MQEAEMASASAAQLRLKEATYFYGQFILHCGPPRDSYFHMACYFDAFAFALTSVEEMVDATAKQILRDTPVFRFIKALRNITSHHSVLAASHSGAKFVRPFARHVEESLGGPPDSSARLAIRYANFRAIFDAIEAERPGEKHTLDVARAYLADLEVGPQPVFLEQVLGDALSKVATVVA